MSSPPVGVGNLVTSLAYGASLLVVLTACGSLADGKPIAGPADPPNKEVSRDAAPVAGAPGTAPPVATPSTASSDAAVAVTSTAQSIPDPPVPGLPVPSPPVPSPPPIQPPIDLSQPDNGPAGGAAIGNPPATITQTDVGPLTTGQPQNAVGVDAQENYLYYPAYGIYVSGRGHQYHYQHGDGWLARPEPEGVTVNALRASPSVPMEFHDAPAHHHAAIMQQYPKTWTPGPAHEAAHRSPGGQPDEHK